MSPNHPVLPDEAKHLIARYSTPATEPPQLQAARCRDQVDRIRTLLQEAGLAPDRYRRVGQVMSAPNSTVDLLDAIAEITAEAAPTPGHIIYAVPNPGVERAYLTSDLDAAIDTAEWIAWDPGGYVDYDLLISCPSERIRVKIPAPEPVQADWAKTRARTDAALAGTPSDRIAWDV